MHSNLVKPKLHRPIFEGAAQALQAIFYEDRYADKVIEWNLKNQKKWGGRDRRLFAEIVYEVVRWWRRIGYALKQEQNTDPRNAIAAWWWLHYAEKLEFIELNNWDEIQKRWNNPPTRAIRESIPDWLDQLGEKELGSRWDKIIHALNMPAQVYLRANRLKITAKDLCVRLENAEIFAETIADDALRLKERANVFKTEAFKQGLFEMQDLASQKVAPFLKVSAGERVIDACAGAGGKTLHLAALMGNKGRILALDIHQWKLDELKKRSRRAGADIIETRLIESTKVIKRLKDSADAVLLDVPCTGLGVLRRNPDSKWKLSADEVKRLAELQTKILADYSSMVKVGGRMVYSTCSCLTSENHQRIESFITSTGGKWQIAEEYNSYPDENSGDGFYAARLLRLP